MLIDFDECHSTPCQNGGTCEDQVNGFICLCADGYEGTQCQDNTDDCNPNPCLNGGTCTDDVNRYTCTCSDGYTGQTCGSGMLTESLPSATATDNSYHKRFVMA